MFDLTFGNLVAWAVQVAAIGLAGVLLPLLLGVTSPGARLVYLRALLVVCLALPLIQPWVPVPSPASSAVAPNSLEDQALLAGATNSGIPSTSMPASFAPAGPPRWPVETIVLGVWVSGVALRLAWLGVGLLSLARLRRTSTRLVPRPSAVDDAALLTGVDADFRVSSRVVRPVTFGLRRPVVLVPPSFLSFAADQQTAVAAHELLHVARRDWLRTLGDELILSVFWFHPALWWLVEQIHLSVEQVVDSAVVQLVGARKPYLEALLKLAAAGPTPMLQPASAFLKHGHLAQRVALLVREASMSRLRLVASFAVALVVLLGGGWYVVQAFPLTAVVEAVAAPLPSAPISVAAPLATPPPPPPAPAKQKADQATGQQTKPTVPPSAQTATPGAVPLPKVPPPPPPPPPPGEKSANYVPPLPFDPVAWEKNVQSVTARMAAAPSDPTLPYTLGTLYWERIYRDTGLTRGQKDVYLRSGYEALDSALATKPEYVDALVYKNLLLRSQASLETDPAKVQSLIAQADALRDQALKLRQAQMQWAAVPSNAVRVGGTIKPPSRLKDVKPVYPASAQSARVQGVVIIEGVIGPDGKIQAARVIRSIPLLDQAALDAFNQWEFAPTMLNGEAVPVVLTATVNFTLQDGPGDKGVAGGVAGGVPGGVPGGVTGGLKTGVPIDDSWVKSIDPNAIRVGGEIRPPAKIADARPIYPQEAQDAKVQGVVILEAVIAPDGHVAGARVLRSIPMLDDAAYSAVMKWYFTPTLLNGNPVSVVMTVTVNFTLQ
jgi:TonB family protein